MPRCMEGDVRDSVFPAIRRARSFVEQFGPANHGFTLSALDVRLNLYFGCGDHCANRAVG